LNFYILKELSSFYENRGEITWKTSFRKNKDILWFLLA